MAEAPRQATRVKIVVFYTDARKPGGTGKAPLPRPTPDGSSEPPRSVPSPFRASRMSSRRAFRWSKFCCVSVRRRSRSSLSGRQRLHQVDQLGGCHGVSFYGRNRSLGVFACEQAAVGRGDWECYDPMERSLIAYVYAILPTQSSCRRKCFHIKGICVA